MNTATLRLPPASRGLHDITEDVADVVVASGVTEGLCHVFLQHTSASLIIQENADPDVLSDMLDWFAKHVPDGDPAYRHRDEGPDDMPSHIRAALTQPSLLVPVRSGQLALGTWQAIYLFEHRHAPHERRLVVTVF
ncbi:MAG: YjbQ family protein [Alphaproteobacteria bacterium]|nr:YjbQ family protein [Alphaproteobacteria bacterium]